MKKASILLFFFFSAFWSSYDLSAQSVKWKQSFTYQKIIWTTKLDRNDAHMDLDGDGKPEITSIYNNTMLIRFPSGELTELPINVGNQSVEGYQFAGFYNFFSTENGLKQVLMTRREGKRIIGILIGVVKEDEIDFTTPIPEAINSPDTVIVNIKNYSGLNCEEIMITYQDGSGFEIWGWD